MKTTIAVGLATGAMYFAHAMIPYSHAWPLIWPVVGGVAIEVLTARHHRLTDLGQGLRLAGATGLVTAVLFFAATVAALTALQSSAFAPLAHALGAHDDYAFTTAALRGVGIAALAGLALAIVAGAITFPIARNRR